MSLCSHCRTVTIPVDEGGVFRLTHPLPHTTGKLRTVLGKHYQLEPTVPGSVAVVLPAGARDHVIALLEGSLSLSERQDCKALLLPEGELLSFDKMTLVQPLDKFIAKARSGWLVEMLQQNSFYADFQPIVRATSPTEVFAYECLLSRSIATFTRPVRHVSKSRTTRETPVSKAYLPQGYVPRRVSKHDPMHSDLPK